MDLVATEPLQLVPTRGLRSCAVVGWVKTASLPFFIVEQIGSINPEGISDRLPVAPPRGISPTNGHRGDGC
jgi:hypothetical protein